MDLSILTTSPLVYFYIAISSFVLVIIVCAYYKKRKREQKRAAQIAFFKKQYTKWRNEIDRSGLLVAKDCPLFLKKGEQCLWQEGGVVLHEPRAVRYSSHTYGSVSLGHGVRVGSGYSTGESKDEWRRISTGRFYVTNKFLYFDGGTHNRKIPIEKIITLNADISAIEVGSESRQKSMILANVNGYIVRDLFRIIMDDELNT